MERYLIKKNNDRNDNNGMRDESDECSLVIGFYTSLENSSFGLKLSPFNKAHSILPVHLDRFATGCGL